MSRDLNDLTPPFRVLADQVIAQWLRQPCPANACPYTENSALGYAVSFRKCGVSRRTQFAFNIKNLIWRQATCAGEVAAPFGNHVVNVILLIAKEQMIWPHASPIVTFVKHIHSGWNLPEMDDPRSTMGQNGSVAPPHAERSIGSWPNVGCPVPTAISWQFVHLSPEPLGHRLLLAVSKCAFTATMFASPGLHLVRHHEEGYSARAFDRESHIHYQYTTGAHA